MKNKLSADPTALIFGLISLVIVLLGCCCGLASLVALGFSIAGLVMANKSLKEYDSEPEVYDHKSKNNVSTGKVLCIIGIAASAIVTIIWLVYFILVGKIVSDEFLEKYNNTRYEMTKDTITNNYEGEIQEVETLTIDTISIDTIKQN